MAGVAESSVPPKIRRASTQSHSAQPAPEVKAPAVSGELQPGKLRFAPVTRGPFSAGRTSAGSRSVPPPADVPSRSDAKPARPRIELEDDEPF